MRATFVICFCLYEECDRASPEGPVGGTCFRMVAIAFTRLSSRTRSGLAIGTPVLGRGLVRTVKALKHCLSRKANAASDIFGHRSVFGSMMRSALRKGVCSGGSVATWFWVTWRSKFRVFGSCYVSQRW